MESYQLNMARSFVMPLEARRKWLRWIMAYLVAMSAVLAWILCDVVSGVAWERARKEGLDRQEEAFLEAHSAYRNIGECLSCAAGKVAGAVRDADWILAAKSSEIPVARILLGLAEPLPAGFELGSFDFDGAGSKVRVEIVIPAAMKLDDAMTPPTLVALWERSSMLAGCVSQIEVENTERVKRNGVEVVCWRFVATAGGK